MNQMSSQRSEQVKLYIQSYVIAKVIQTKIKNDFPRLSVTLTGEAPKENSSLKHCITITELYDACVDSLTDFVVPFAMDNNAILRVMFDKDPAGNTETCHDFSVK